MEDLSHVFGIPDLLHARFRKLRALSPTELMIQIIDFVFVTLLLSHIRRITVFLEEIVINHGFQPKIFSHCRGKNSIS